MSEGFDIYIHPRGGLHGGQVLCCKFYVFVDWYTRIKAFGLLRELVLSVYWVRESYMTPLLLHGHSLVLSVDLSQMKD